MQAIPNDLDLPFSITGVAHLAGSNFIGISDSLSTNKESNQYTKLDK